MDNSEHFKVNAPNVVHEVIEGEAVIVNLGDGTYYSVDKVGADVWTLVDSGAPVGRIVDAISGRYAGSREIIEQGITRLLGELQQERLIVADPGPLSKPDGAWELPGGLPAARPDFQEPLLQKYTDMEDLLLLDPIHEVDETGWPNPKPEEAVT